MAGAQVVIDLSNSPSFEDKAVLDFFETSGRNLLAAESAAGVRSHVALSIVGIDRTPDNGYFRAKVAQDTTGLSPVASSNCPSPSRSQAYVKLSPPGSVEPPASKDKSSPSLMTYGPPALAVGATLWIVKVLASVSTPPWPSSTCRAIANSVPSVGRPKPAKVAQGIAAWHVVHLILVIQPVVIGVGVVRVGMIDVDFLVV